MKGLLLKDWLMIKKYCRSYVFILAIFYGISVFSPNNLFFLVYPVVMASMIPFSLISYDEKSRWASYADTLPVSRRQVVHVKYITTLLLMLAANILSGIALLISGYFHKDFDIKLIPGILGMVGMLGIMIPSLTLPLGLRFGAEKGRVITYLAIVVACAGAGTLGALVQFDVEIPLLQGGWILFLAGSLIVLAVSWLWAIRLYQKREL